MRKNVWYGYSQKDNRTHFFDQEPKGSNDDLVGTGNFTIDGDVQGLNIETVQQGTGGRQPERA